MQSDDKKNEEIIIDETHPGNLMESKTSHLDDILNEKLESAFHKETFQIVAHDLAKIVREHSPIDLAYAASRLPAADRQQLYENLSDLNAKIEFLVNTDRNTRIIILRRLSDSDVKKLIENMAPDDAVAVLEDMAERRFRRIVDMLNSSKAKKIREIHKHQRNTAGRLMTNEFFAFTVETAIGEAASVIHNNPGIDLTRSIFVVDQDGKLQGYVPIRNLVINSDNTPLRQVMRPVEHSVTVEATREEVVDIAERYKIMPIPVVDEDNHLLGVITDEDVVETIEDIADETIASMAGTTEKVKEHDPLLKRFLSRSPWLVVTLAAGLINMEVMSTFQGYEKGLLTFVLFFVPLITGMSGNIGIQSSTILVRSMATGRLSLGNKGEAMMKEIILGTLNGVVFGLICGFLIYGFNILGMTNVPLSAGAIGLIIGIGLFGACVTGAALGVFFPFLFARIGVDPAIASGPIITALNDFLSMTIYFLIAIALSAFLFY